MQEARLSHGGVPDDDEAELVDPDGLHRSRAQRTLRPPHPPTRRRANKAAGTVRSAPPRRPPAGFQHIPAAAAATRSPPSLDGEAGPGRGRGVASGQGAGQGREEEAGAGGGRGARNSLAARGFPPPTSVNQFSPKLTGRFGCGERT